MPLDLMQLFQQSPAQQVTQPPQAQTMGQPQPSFFRQLLSPEVALPVAGALMGNRGNAGNLGAAFSALGPALQSNKTFQYLEQQDPELAQAVRNGLLDPKDAYGLMLQKRRAQEPKYRYDTINGNLVRTDEHGGDSSVVYRGEGARPMTPQERQQWGISADDTRPYIMDGGKPRALGGQNINVNMGAERSYDSTVGGGYGKRFLDIQNSGQAAQRALGTLSAMESASQKNGFYSGTGAGTVLQLKRAAQSLGLPGAEDVDSMETFNALSKQSALDAMGGSLGAGFSNADRDFVIGQVPNLDNTPAGNAKLIEIQRKIAQRTADVSNLARQYAQQNGGRIDAGFDDYLAKWADQNPIFPAAPPPGMGMLPGDGGRSRINNPPARAGGGPVRARNPATGAIVEWNGSQWVPAQ